MSFQPMKPPLMDFTVTSVQTPDASTSNGVVLIAVVQYEHLGKYHEARYEFVYESGSFVISTQSQAISLPTAQFLGSLLANINGDSHAQVH